MPDAPLNVGVRVLGAEPAGLGEHFPPPDGDADVVLVVRTNGTPGDLAALREPEPHLLLDLAYHHTVSLSSFVVPGASACLGCLAVHARRRWAIRSRPPERLAAGSPALLDRLVTTGRAVPTPATTRTPRR